MFAQVDHHSIVPTDPVENTKFRKLVLARAKTDPVIQAALMRKCREDIIFFLRVFMWQFNPDTMDKAPFIPYPFQETAIVGGEIEAWGQKRYQHGLLECIADRKTVRWQKSRYCGATWVCVAVAVWLCLFQKNIKCLFMSRDEDTASDAKDSDSLFWKVNFLVDHLPNWMKGSARQQKKGVIGFDRDNAITSTANVESAGVGGRCTFMVIDEFGQFRKGHEVFSMTKDTARCRAFVFTHKGRGTMAHEICFDAKYTEMREIMTHWSMDPAKGAGKYRYLEDGNRIEHLDPEFVYSPKFKFVYDPKPVGGPFVGIRSPWYDQECKERSDYDIAMNLDIDPIGSSVLFFEPFRVAVLKRERCRPPKFQGWLSYDKETGQPLRLVDNPNGKLKIWLARKGELEFPYFNGGAGSDVSAGSGATPSCLVLYSADTGDLALEYADADIHAPDFAVFVVACLRLFKNRKGIHPLLGWEIQGSQAFEKRVKELRYSPYYIKREEDTLGRARDNKGRAGINCSSRNILTMMEEYRDAMFKGLVTNFSEDAMDEALNFIYTATSVEYRGSKKRGEADESGAKIHHGDRIRAGCIAHKMIVELGFSSATGKLKTIEGVVPDVRTSGYRDWLAEHQAEAEGELVWK